MPNAPKQHRPPGWVPPAQRRREREARRQSAGERGYSTAWHKLAAALKQEQVFCALCLTIGIETDIISKGIADHVIPVTGPDDPLFHDPAAIWCLCTSCDRWKSINFDGTYGGKRQVVADRSPEGVAKRRAEIVAKFKAHQAHWR